MWEFGYVPRLAFVSPTNDPGNMPDFYSATPVQLTNLPSNVVGIRADWMYGMALTKTSVSPGEAGSKGRAR